MVEGNFSYRDFSCASQVLDSLKKYYLGKNKWLMKKQKIINQNFNINSGTGSLFQQPQQLFTDKQVLDFLVTTGKMKLMVKFLEELKIFIEDYIKFQKEEKQDSAFSKKLMNYQQKLMKYKMIQIQNRGKISTSELMGYSAEDRDRDRNINN